jgi:hypothetical protein
MIRVMGLVKIKMLLCLLKAKIDAMKIKGNLTLENI